MNAKEYFEGIRAEVVKTDKAREMLERMKAREGAKVQSYQAGSSGGGACDPMDSVSRRIDFEGKLRQRIEDSEQAIDEACEILYGSDGRGGLAKLKGNQYADAICMAYCQAEPWGEIAEIMQSSVRWCHTLCDVGFKYIDSVGWAKLKNA